jgi:excisionase family DNA binding protein
MAEARGAVVSVEEAATRMGCDPSLIRRYIRQGRLSAMRIGERPYAIASEELERFAALPRRAGRPHS